MPGFNPSIANPSVNAAPAFYQQLGWEAYKRPVIQHDRDQALDRGRQVWSRETLPQLQSGIAASGQFYGSAANKAEDLAADHYKWQKSDVASAAQRQLDELTRQRAFASVGLII